MRETAGGVVGQFIGNGLAANLNFLGATLFCWPRWMAGVSLAFGVSWLTIVDRIGAGIWNAIGWIKARRSMARDVAVGLEAKKARVEAAKVEEKRVATRVKPRIEAPAPVVEKSERVEKERQVPLFDAPKSGELPPLKLLDDPPAHEAALFAGSARGHVAPGRAQAQGFRRRSRSGRRAARARSSRAIEMRPAPGVKVSQISSLAKDLARSLSAISVRVVEVIPGKSVMGLEIPNEKREIVTLGEIIKSKAYDDVASPLAHRARQGHRRRAGVRGSRQDAAPADRRHHRLGQVGRHQRHDPVAALQEHRRTRAPDHDRSEDARALGVRGHSAPARAGGHGHETRRQRVALVRGGDGAALRSSCRRSACATSRASTAR